MSILNDVVSNLDVILDNPQTDGYNSIRECDYNGHHIRFNNETVAWVVDQNVIYSNNELLINIFHAFICACCGEIHSLDESMHTTDGLVCEGCSTNYECCCECDGPMTHIDDLNWDTDSESYYCDDCWNATHRHCYECGSSCNTNSMITVYYNIGAEYLCQNCVDNSTNILRCEQCGAYNDHNRIVCGECGRDLIVKKNKTKLKTYDKVQCYHPNITLTPIDNYRKIVPIDKFKGYGIELEINKDNIRPNDNNSLETFNLLKEINKYLGGHAYYSRDGSLTNGFEIVTQPHTEKAMHNIKWEKLFETLKKNNFTDNSQYAGYHIHISRTLFGDTEQEIQDNLAKLIYFFEKNREHLIKMSRRENTRWCPFYTDPSMSLYDTSTYKTLTGLKPSQQLSKDIVDGKIGIIRGAVNLRYAGSPTVEIRLFRSTLNYTEFMGSFDFVTTLVHNIKNISWRSINNNKKWLKGLSTVGREYLKSKKVLGVN